LGEGSRINQSEEGEKEKKRGQRRGEVELKDRSNTVKRTNLYEVALHRKLD